MLEDRSNQDVRNMRCTRNSDSFIIELLCHIDMFPELTRISKQFFDADDQLMSDYWHAHPNQR